MEWPYSQETNQQQATSMRLSTSFTFMVSSLIDVFLSQVILEASAIFLSLHCEYSISADNSITLILDPGSFVISELHIIFQGHSLAREPIF
jgi:hypothetical protein